ncbi:unnamed protein product, partial [Caretta caretta]
LIITIIALAAKKTPPCPRCPPHVTAACPDGWVGYQGNCYHFSETEGNWSMSQSHCSSLNASLASIDSLTELVSGQRGRAVHLPERTWGQQLPVLLRETFHLQAAECSRRKPSAAGGDMMAKIT